MTSIQSFRDLDAWKASMKLALEAHTVAKQCRRVSGLNSLLKSGAPLFQFHRMLPRVRHMALGVGIDITSGSPWVRGQNS